ncbi:TonB-dependent siderophore receptor [Aliikangiella sp. G2MR2-5]|uniref:TonB-dependent receptor plug domain-containing protein n=1 Tax=Aliikangiella sp. G2MR2-5 TaxID=2788943 RepID=UPI0018AC0E0B|nr:TonB-dependent receptor [Aliikangiella sp. G2MR2-5]
MKNDNLFRRNSINIAVLLSLSLSGNFAFAEETEGDEDKEQKMTIVGSHIKRSDMEGPSPITSLSAEDIIKTGVTDMIGLFEKLPISGQGTFSTQGNSSDDTANGGSSVSLRGLGADSTLILINGRRVSVSPFAKNIQTAFVDINNIPLSAIKRIDILKDGASATYGSDAIAGVINIELKNDFEGAELSGKVGGTSDGGGSEKNVSMIWGNSGRDSSHTFIMDYYQREEILYADRDYARSANQAALRPNDPDAVDFRSSSGIPGTIALASDPGNRIIDTFGSDVCAPEDIDLDNNLCRYDYAPYMSMVPETERFSIIYNGSFEINENVNAFIELNTQNAKTKTRGAGSPSFNELFMSGDNPNHPFADDPAHPFYQQDLTMRRRTVDIGNRLKITDTNYNRSIFGLEGEVGTWSWESAVSYIRSHSVERGVDGFPNSERIQDAIDSGLWNPFEPSSNTQEALDYIETTTTRIGKSSNRSFDISFSGPLMEMDSGELMLAVGAEYREESISDNPDDQYLRGNVFGTEATQANGERDNTSVFGELAIPVTEAFELQLAVRYEDYSDFGNTTNPKVAFRYAPNEDMVFRGSYGTAFRAPSLHQIGLGTTNESPTLVDNVRCAAVGQDCAPREYTVVFEGNPDLQPEESTSYNFGWFYQVNEQMSFSVDYYNYDIEDIIDSYSQWALDNLSGDPSVVVRLNSADPNDPGEVVEIYDSFRNVGDLETSGLDIDLRYDMEIEMGKIDFGFTLNYVLDYEELRNDDPYKEAGDFEQPEMRWTFSTGWSGDNANANVAINYIDEFKGDAGTGFGDKTVDSMMTVDAVYNYLGFEDMTFSIGATNLFNEEPPFSHHDFMGFVSTVHSGQGRFLYAQASYQFK